jgi:hypothetical protein
MFAVRVGRSDFAGVQIVAQAEASSKIADEESAGDCQEDNEEGDDTGGFTVANGDGRQLERPPEQLIALISSAGPESNMEK